MRIFVCEHCGNMVEMVKDSGVAVMCCGQKMTELVHGTSDGAVEKHVPVVVTDGNNISVTVGEVEHPMADVHYIEWIAVETSNGIYRKMLNPGDQPKAEFILTEGESVAAVYAYCNLHGLWKA